MERGTRSCRMEFRSGVNKPAEACGEEDSAPDNENGPVLLPKSARIASGLRHRLLRKLLDLSMCRDGRLEEWLSERRAVKTFAARRNYQASLGTFFQIDKELALFSWRRRRNRRCFGCGFERLLRLGSSASPWFTVLAAVMDRWPLFSPCGPQNFEVPSMFEVVARAYTCVHPTSNACTGLGRHYNTTLCSNNLQVAASVLKLLVTYFFFVRQSFWH